MPALAQGPLAPEIGMQITELRQYLELTDAQLEQLLRINRDFNVLLSQREQRIRQVQIEIDEETRKEALDPAALGIRYAEVEALCREMRDRYVQSQRQSRQVLTPAQMTRIRALEEAWRLMPLINQAQNLGVFEPMTPGPRYLPTRVMVGVPGGPGGGVGGSFASFLLGGSLSGCRPELVANPWFTTGGFNAGAAATR